MNKVADKGPEGRAAKGGKNMLRKVIMGVLVLVCVVLAAACSRNTDDTNGTSDAAATGSVTPGAGEPTTTPTGTAADPTATVTATPTTTETTPTGTVTPTVTPEGELNLAEVAARNRELHELTAPGTKANPLGTSPELSERERLDYEYGITRSNNFRVALIDENIGMESYYWSSDNISFRITGLKDEEVAAKIEDRIGTVARAMAKPEYLPNVSGVMTIVKERGLPSSEFEYRTGYSKNGILSLELNGQWYWEEIVRFDKIEDYTEFYYSPPEQPPFDRVKAEWYEQEDGYVRAGIRYYLSENVYLNFDLATGKELSLSDLFPKGEYYLEDLKKRYEESNRYVFEFFDEIYQDKGEIRGTDDYDETLEYDGGALLHEIDGSESFYIINDNDIYLATDTGAVTLWLDCPIRGRSRGKELYTSDYVSELAPIGSVVMCGTPMPGETKKIGSFRACLDGEHEITVNVFRGNDTPKWYPSCGTQGFGAGDTEWLDDYIGRQQNIVDQYFSDENIIEFAKQCVECWPDKTLADRDLGFVIQYATTYPNGFYRVFWSAANENGLWTGNGHYDHFDEATVWMKDGKVIAEEELFDVSYRELFTELFLNMRIDSDEGVIPVISDEEQAKAAADLVLSHFKGFNSYVSTYPLLYTGQYWFEFWDDSDGAIRKEAQRRMSEWKESMPDRAWRQLMAFWGLSSTDIFYEDGYLIYRHLRMYQGFSFD